MKKGEAPDEKDEEDDVGEGGGEVDHLTAGLDSLAQAEEDNEPGEREGQRQVVFEAVQVPEVRQSGPDAEDVFLPELLGTALESGAVVSNEGGAPAVVTCKVRSGQVSGLQVMRKCLYLAGNVIVRYVQLLLLKINILIADLEV